MFTNKDDCILTKNEKNRIDHAYKKISSVLNLMANFERTMQFLIESEGNVDRTQSFYSKLNTLRRMKKYIPNRLNHYSSFLFNESSDFDERKHINDFLNEYFISDYIDTVFISGVKIKGINKEHERASSMLKQLSDFKKIMYSTRPSKLNVPYISGIDMYTYEGIKKHIKKVFHSVRYEEDHKMILCRIPKQDIGLVEDFLELYLDEDFKDLYDKYNLPVST